MVISPFNGLSIIISGVTPRNMEGRARLKRREVDLDDALVEDMPPSKIKGTRPQENHDVEGSSKVRSRFGSVARGIKGKHPRLDVQESAQKRTRSVNVARGIKAKHPRSRKHRDVNEGEIHKTTYRASLNGMKTLIEELNLSEEHKNVLIWLWAFEIWTTDYEICLVQDHVWTSRFMVNIPPKLVGICFSSSNCIGPMACTVGTIVEKASRASRSNSSIVLRKKAEALQVLSKLLIVNLNITCLPGLWF
ncbi:hypothetical protein RHGRI_021557 [Rhododendron griersonianum]|uniref:Uncharacterized protein n=1 Tax=Rhododendron griersonianum TaxID=479676 RepID=A0AAV6JQ49_9ERIC|nr:hypothetical protein RHGRI_021557 [Rhododendron griersonianum]